MTCHDKAAFLQELIRVYRNMRGENIEELPEIQFPDDSTPGGGGG